MKKTTVSQQFASDNYSGICPEAWTAMARANNSHCPAYGDDEWTIRATEMIRTLFNDDCEVFFVFNGTAGNSLALASMCQSYNGVICHELAHIITDECGAPGFFTNGAKLWGEAGQHGKLTPQTVIDRATKRDDLHHPKAKALSLTQATEAGTLYTPSELRALCAAAKEHKLYVHMDGARFANAVAALSCSPREITVACGVDVLCLGGTKNGMAVGDAVVFFNRALAEDFEWRCKQAGQLASKMRYIAAPWVGLLENDVWLKNGSHANNSAAYLEQRIRAISGIDIVFPRQVNTLFVQFDQTAQLKLAAKGWRFYNFVGAGARFMCSWDTSRDQIDQFADDIEAVLTY